ncbi:MAG: amidohydrolase family protein [Flavobacteriia bacterium]|nr:amidohydrolase family protein [Flavobacteriia bacterium]
MKRAYILTSLAMAVVLTACDSGPSDNNRKQYVFTNATLVTPDSTVEGYSIATMAGKISDFHKGSDFQWVANDTIDLKGAYLYAGFIDAHAHFVGYAKGLQSVNLIGTKSWEEVVSQTKLFIEAHPNFNFITGRGWDQNDWGEGSEFPTNKALNEAFPNLPVVLTRIDGHAVIANDAALQLAHITAETTIDGGLVLVEAGRPTGVLIDNATSLIQIPEISNSQLANALLQAEQNCFAVGLTTIDDAGLSKPMIDFIDSLQQAAMLKMRLYAMVSDHPDWLEYYLSNGPYKTDRLNVRSFKFYGDGALGSRGACLRQPYHDDSDNYGLILSTEEHFRESARRLAAAGFQMNTHAIGDSANHLILDIYNDALSEVARNMDYTGNPFRWRIEHAQVVSPEDLSRFTAYGIIPSVQPTHATSDMYWADERLGEERIHHAYAYQDLLNNSDALPLGTDFPVEGIDPLNTFYAAVVRKDHEGYPDDGFQMENALSREDALRGMTIWAAYSNFEEDEKGSIERGKWADFTILDTDLLHCPEEEILQAKVLFTVIGGEVVFTNEQMHSHE